MREHAVMVVAAAFSTASPLDESQDYAITNHAKANADTNTKTITYAVNANANHNQYEY